MEGIYFFGEYERWNLGWENPNQAGVFVAMWIPFFWVAARKCNWVGWLTLILELGLWFLLCKTYSRGALVAVAAAGCFWMLGKMWMERGGFRAVFPSRVAVGRLLGISALLFATGFFARIDPSYVSQDASAGNRLTLWKGGLQMISAAPWQGWGKGNSGSGFMQWFQPLEADEAYAGMVNSYLHVGVEYGLPVLAVVLAAALYLLALSVPRSGSNITGIGKNGWVRLAAGASLVVFLVANVFSTLWIFGNLWWLVGLGIGLVLLGSYGEGGVCIRMRNLLGGACAVAVLLCSCLFLAGKLSREELIVRLDEGRDVLVHTRDSARSFRVLFFPDRSVLGDSWGKEIRRLATDVRFRDGEILVAGGDLRKIQHQATVIIACGGSAQKGMDAVAAFPESRLILVHPIGRPDQDWTGNGKVSVLLPGLDTSGGGGIWRRISKRNGWECKVSKGVAQDIRLIWPSVLPDLQDDWSN